jgi:hypothetical protein
MTTFCCGKSAEKRSSGRFTPKETTSAMCCEVRHQRLCLGRLQNCFMQSAGASNGFVSEVTVRAVLFFDRRILALLACSVHTPLQLNASS